MADPFIGEIRMFGFNFPPRDYAFCNGEIIEIEENPALFALLSNRYGGDGTTTFALPDFRGRVPVHNSSQYPLGGRAGLEQVTLNLAQLASHTHQALGTTAEGNQFAPSSTRGFATSTDTGDPIYQEPSTSMVAMNQAVIGDSNGGGGAHNNMQPSQVINFCIVISGLFPPRN